MKSVPVHIDAGHPALAGHFPSRPVMPGVVLLDESLRAIVTTFGIDDETLAAAIWKIGVAKFLSPIGPGESLRVDIELTSGVSNADEVRREARATSYAVRMFAGTAPNERLALSATVSLEPRVTLPG